MKLRQPFALLILLLTAVLVGCGGNDANSPKSSTGYFVDSGVEGLEFFTSTSSGKTGPGGSFPYVVGSNVEFKLYGQKLLQSTMSSALSTQIVTPFHVNISTTHPAYPLNVMRFLLSIDTDQNPSNGITLPIHTGSFNINFNQSLSSFEADSDGKIRGFLTTYAQGRSLYPLKDTVTHFSNTLATVGPSTGYSLSFQGKTAKSEIVNSNCQNVKGGWTYTFGVQSFTMQGVDSFFGEGNLCSLGQSDTLNYPYPTSPAQRTNEFLGCLPTCAYHEINRISWIASDEDGRTAVEYSWHTPGSNTISYVKQIVKDDRNNNLPASLSYFYEIITFN